MLAHTPGLSPLRGSLRAARRQEYHYVLTRSWQKQLVRCFWTGGYRSPPYLAVFYGESPQAGLGAPSRVASRLSSASSGNVFQSPDVTGHGPVFFKVHRGQEKPPHCVGSERALFISSFQKIFYFFQPLRNCGLGAAPFFGQLALIMPFNHNKCK